MKRIVTLGAIAAVIIFLALAIAFGPRFVQGLNSRPGTGNGIPFRTPDSSPSGQELSRLTPETEGPCKGLYKIPGTDLCTHGSDAAPPGVNIKTNVPPVKP